MLADLSRHAPKRRQGAKLAFVLVGLMLSITLLVMALASMKAHDQTDPPVAGQAVSESRRG